MSALRKRFPAINGAVTGRDQWFTILNPPSFIEINLIHNEGSMKTTITQDLAEHENLASQCSSLGDVIRFSLLGRLVISYCNSCL